MKKRGLSGVVTAVILILLVIVAIVLIWIVVRTSLNRSSEEIDPRKITLDLTIMNAQIQDNRLNISIYRDSGQGEYSRMKVVLSDGLNSQSYWINDSMKNLETREYIVEINPGLDPKTAVVYPIFIVNNNEKLGMASNKKEIIKITVIPIFFKSFTGNGKYDSVFYNGSHIKLDGMLASLGGEIPSLTGWTEFLLYTSSASFTRVTNPDPVYGNYQLYQSSSSGMWFYYKKYFYISDKSAAEKINYSFKGGIRDGQIAIWFKAYDNTSSKIGEKCFVLIGGAGTGWCADCCNDISQRGTTDVLKIVSYDLKNNLESLGVNWGNVQKIGIELWQRGRSYGSATSYWDFPFKLYGSYESEVIDANFGAVWRSIIFDKIIDSNSNIIIKAKSCDDSLCAGESYTVSCTNSPCDLSSLPSNRYFQYKIDFSSTSENSSPTIVSNTFSINYQQA